ncbi:MAG: hypothetical protein HYW78_02170 [Parcubacteria group bacterium]|nr:hypothetical protein [Parcubacteria group bacterium]
MEENQPQQNQNAQPSAPAQQVPQSAAPIPSQPQPSAPTVSPAPNVQQPQIVEDIFSDAKSAVPTTIIPSAPSVPQSQPAPQPSSPQPTPTPMPAIAQQPAPTVQSAQVTAPPVAAPAEEKKGGSKIFLLILKIILYIAGVAIVYAATAYLDKHFLQKNSDALQNQDQEQNVGGAPQEQDISAPSVSQNNESGTAGNQPIDSDGDGLSDTDEARLGTDPLKTDSDGDGLYDKEEVEIYKTNPLSADSDGDGINDKEDVAGQLNVQNEAAQIEQ